LVPLVPLILLVSSFGLPGSFAGGAGSGADGATRTHWPGCVMEMGSRSKRSAWSSMSTAWWGIELQCRSHRFRDALHLIARYELRVCGLSAAAVRVVAVVMRPDQSELLRWRQHGERVLYESPWVTVTKVDVTPPDGNRFEHHAVRLQRVAMAVVVDDADRVLMVWRHRFITDSWGWELPGGIVDDGEDGVVTAERETVEETGWRPEGLSLLAQFQPMPGLVDTPHEVYGTRHALKVGEPSDPVEVGVVDWVPLAELLGMIRAGDVAGAGSIVGLLHVLADPKGLPE